MGRLRPATLHAPAATLRRFARDRRGATALEFALVGAPFLTMMIGLIELGFIFLISTTLENATNDAARTIRTGQLQTGGTASASTFKTAICTGMGWAQTQCNAGLYVDVEPYSTFQSTNNQGAPITNGQFSSTNLQFSCGGPSQIVLVRAYFTWPLFAPGFDKALQKLSNGSTVITAASVFRNEPYTPGSTSAC